MSLRPTNASSVMLFEFCKSILRKVEHSVVKFITVLFDNAQLFRKCNASRCTASRATAFNRPLGDLILKASIFKVRKCWQFDRTLYKLSSLMLQLLLPVQTVKSRIRTKSPFCFEIVGRYQTKPL